MAINQEYYQIGNDIIGSAFNVRNKAGIGLRESFYEAALVSELKNKGYNVERQVLLPAVYDGIEIEDAYRMDIVVDRRVIIEVKAVSSMTDAESRQLMTYLKLSGYKLGYLINFGARTFTTGKISDPFPYTHGIYRIINNLW